MSGSIAIRLEPRKNGPTIRGPEHHPNHSASNPYCYRPWSLSKWEQKHAETKYHEPRERPIF